MGGGDGMSEAEVIAGIDYAKIKRKLEEVWQSGGAGREALREELRLISIYIDNGLNQDVTIQVKANREKAYDKSVNVGSSFTVSANSQDARTLSPETSGWLPYIMVEVNCSVAPTSGSLTVWLIRSKYDQVKLVDGLEIRDTNLHTPSSDSDKILIQEW